MGLRHAAHEDEVVPNQIVTGSGPYLSSSDYPKMS